MSPRSTEERYRDMIRFAERAIEALGDRDAAALSEDFVRLDAIMFNIVRIGEAAARIRDAEEDRQPELPWHLMTGMRNALVHRYFETAENKVHATVRQDLPGLLEQLRAIVGDV
jgi:uncharacterized protein with HEPN domain